MQFKRNKDGFTLTEVIVTTAIIGTLSSIAIPGYMNTLQSMRQKEAELTVATLQTAALAFVEENGRYPKGWDDIDKIKTIPTNSGAASGASYTEITLPSENYKLSATLNNSEGIINFESDPVSSNAKILNWNIIACVNMQTGLSEIKLGNKDNQQKSNPSNQCK